VNYVLDGQQRLSTIYAVFAKNRTQAPNENAGLKTFDISFDLDKGAFCAQEDFDITAFVKDLKDIPESYHARIQELHSRFNNYEVPVVTITRRSKTEAGIIFVEEVLHHVLETQEEQDRWLSENRENIQGQIRRGIEELDRGEGIPQDRLESYLADLKTEPE
jgi:hypothetical protein